MEQILKVGLSLTSNQSFHASFSEICPAYTKYVIGMQCKLYTTIVNSPYFLRTQKFCKNIFVGHIMAFLLKCNICF